MDHKVDSLLYTMTALAGPRRDAAGVLFRDPQGRVMLLKAPYKAYVDLPGGMVEAGETPPAAACREVQEELGLTLREPLRLLVADYLTYTPTRQHGYRFVFDGGVLGRGYPLHELEMRLQPGEVEEVLWCDRADVMRLLCHHAPMLQRRVMAAMWAAKSLQFATPVDQTVRMTNGWQDATGLLRRTLPITTS